MSLEDRYAALFAHATDTYARQWPDGHGYRRVEAPLTPEVIRRHLRGEATIALYLLDARDTARYGVIDHDGERVVRDAWGMPLRDEAGRPLREPEDGLARLREAQDRFAGHGIETALERSRRGGHLWLFAREPVPARAMRALLLLAAQDVALEAYPKGDARGGGVGSAIRAPLGVHRASGERYGFVGPDGVPVAPTLGGQIDYLENIRRVDVAGELARWPHLRHLLAAADDRLVALPPRRPRGAMVREAPPDSLYSTARAGNAGDAARAGNAGDAARAGNMGAVGGAGAAIRSWVEGVRLEDIVRAYLPLSRGLVGHCPWPEHHRNGDAHPSFAVSARTQRWRCYTSGAHGDAFDFVARMEGHRGAAETLAYVRSRWPASHVSSLADDTMGR